VVDGVSFDGGPASLRALDGWPPAAGTQRAVRGQPPPFRVTGRTGGRRAW